MGRFSDFIDALIEHPDEHNPIRSEFFENPYCCAVDADLTDSEIEKLFTMDADIIKDAYLKDHGDPKNSLEYLFDDFDVDSDWELDHDDPPPDDLTFQSLVAARTACNAGAALDPGRPLMALQGAWTGPSPHLRNLWWRPEPAPATGADVAASIRGRFYVVGEALMPGWHLVISDLSNTQKSSYELTEFSVDRFRRIYVRTDVEALDSWIHGVDAPRCTAIVDRKMPGAGGLSNPRLVRTWQYPGT